MKYDLRTEQRIANSHASQGPQAARRPGWPMGSATH
jgi:hypothetical protein